MISTLAINHSDTRPDPVLGLRWRLRGTLTTDARGGERAVRSPIWLPLRASKRACRGLLRLVVHEAAIVAELFCRYVGDGVSIAESIRLLTSIAGPLEPASPAGTGR